MLHFHNYTRLALQFHGAVGPIKFADKNWEVISLGVNFAANPSQYFVLLNSTNDLERLFVDTKSKLINELVEKIASQSALKTQFDILTLVSKYIDAYTTLHPNVSGTAREVIEDNLDQRYSAYLVQRKKGLIPGKPANLDITIDELIEVGLLNCRHKGLLAAIVIGQLIAKNILPFGSSRLYRSLIHIKNNGYNAGHAWAVYNHINANAIWVIDPRWESVIKVDRKKPLKLGYGKYPAREMIKRIEQLDKPLSTNIASAVASSSALAVTNATSTTTNTLATPQRSSYELVSKLIKLYKYYGQKYYMLDMQDMIDMTCKNMLPSNQKSFIETLAHLNIPYELDFELLRIRIDETEFNKHYDAICPMLKSIGTLQKTLAKKIGRATSIRSLIKTITEFAGFLQAEDGMFVDVEALIKAIANKSNGIEDASDISITSHYGLAAKVDELIQQQLQASIAEVAPPLVEAQPDLPQVLNLKKR